MAGVPLAAGAVGNGLKVAADGLVGAALGAKSIVAGLVAVAVVVGVGLVGKNIPTLPALEAEEACGDGEGISKSSKRDPAEGVFEAVGVVFTCVGLAVVML